MISFPLLLLILQRYEFSSKSQLVSKGVDLSKCCCWYYKGTNFQANHNGGTGSGFNKLLLLILQRYEFSSKSQPLVENYGNMACCCWYYKGTNFQANHNINPLTNKRAPVVADTTKVRIFKQITTQVMSTIDNIELLLILQRYEFSSKSQPNGGARNAWTGCCWYYKGTNFQANHNKKASR